MWTMKSKCEVGNSHKKTLAELSQIKLSERAPKPESETYLFHNCFSYSTNICSIKSQFRKVVIYTSVSTLVITFLLSIAETLREIVVFSQRSRAVLFLLKDSD